MDAEYQGETLHGFKYFKKGPWLYKKDNGEYFAVVITNKNNRYEIQLGKQKNNIQATAAVEKIIKRNSEDKILTIVYLELIVDKYNRMNCCTRRLKYLFS